MSCNPFFAFEGGYQMCLKAYATGNGDGKGIHCSYHSMAFNT